MQFHCAFDPEKGIVVLVIACDPDQRHPDRPAREHMHGFPGVTIVRSISGAPSPELTILDENDPRGLDGIVYDVRQVIALHPGCQILVAVFGHADCKRNPQSEATVQQGQIAASCGILHCALNSDGMGDFRGKLDVAGFYQPVTPDKLCIRAEDTVCLVSSVGVLDYS